MWCPRIWGKEQVRGGGEGVSRRDRNVKQSEWLIAGGWGNRVVGQDHHRDHTTEPVLSPGYAEGTDNSPRDVGTRQTAQIRNQEGETKSRSDSSSGRSSRRNSCHGLV